MSAWRRLALQLFPEHKQWIEDGQVTFSIYQLLFQLQSITFSAHQAKDEDTLGRIYKFAEWCWRQNRSPYIQNAIAVAFYEHLVYDSTAMQDIPFRLSSQIFDGVRLLFEQRLTPEAYKDLLHRYNAVNRTHFT